VAIDGEPHTEAAICWALDHSERLGLTVVAVHVKDPYLKQFSNDIYAQGREEYLQHVDDCLTVKAREAGELFASAAADRDLDWTVKIVAGDPLERLAVEVRGIRCSLVVLGRQEKTGLSAWRSRDLPGKLLANRLGVPLIVVPGDGDDGGAA
jgi:nucleotide-binding universal stress UspA family protein